MWTIEPHEVKVIRNLLKPWNGSANQDELEEQQSYMMLTTFVEYKERCTAFVGSSLAA